jgi:glutamate-1-semialdehyde 2,1-aminomutase
MFEAGVPLPHRSLTSRFAYNDAESLRAAVDAADGDVAAIMLTPFHQGYFGTPMLPTESFLEAIRGQARRTGAVVVLDDVRAGMRMHPSGGSHAEIGLDPDLVCFAKALANGRALSVCGGSAELRDRRIRSDTWARSSRAPSRRRRAWPRSAPSISRAPSRG